MMKRVISLVLALMLCVGMLPVQAFAQDAACVCGETCDPECTLCTEAESCLAADAQGEGEGDGEPDAQNEGEEGGEPDAQNEGEGDGEPDAQNEGEEGGEPDAQNEGEGDGESDAQNEGEEGSTPDAQNEDDGTGAVSCTLTQGCILEAGHASDCRLPDCTCTQDCSGNSNMDCPLCVYGYPCGQHHSMIWVDSISLSSYSLPVTGVSFPVFIMLGSDGNMDNLASVVYAIHDSEGTLLDSQTIEPGQNVNYTQGFLTVSVPGSHTITVTINWKQAVNGQTSASSSLPVEVLPLLSASLEPAKMFAKVGDNLSIVGTYNGNATDYQLYCSVNGGEAQAMTRGAGGKSFFFSFVPAEEHVGQNTFTITCSAEPGVSATANLMVNKGGGIGYQMELSSGTAVKGTDATLTVYTLGTNDGSEVSKADYQFYYTDDRMAIDAGTVEPEHTLTLTADPLSATYAFQKEGHYFCIATLYDAQGQVLTKTDAAVWVYDNTTLSFSEITIDRVEEEGQNVYYARYEVMNGNLASAFRAVLYNGKGTGTILDTLEATSTSARLGALADGEYSVSIDALNEEGSTIQGAYTAFDAQSSYNAIESVWTGDVQTMTMKDTFLPNTMMSIGFNANFSLPVTQYRLSVSKNGRIVNYWDFGDKNEAEAFSFATDRLPGQYTATVTVRYGNNGEYETSASCQFTVDEAVQVSKLRYNTLTPEVGSEVTVEAMLAGSGTPAAVIFQVYEMTRTSTLVAASDEDSASTSFTFTPNSLYTHRVDVSLRRQDGSVSPVISQIFQPKVKAGQLNITRMIANNCALNGTVTLTPVTEGEGSITKWDGQIDGPDGTVYPISAGAAETFAFTDTAAEGSYLGSVRLTTSNGNVIVSRFGFQVFTTPAIGGLTHPATAFEMEQITIVPNFINGGAELLSSITYTVTDYYGKNVGSFGWTNEDSSYTFQITEAGQYTIEVTAAFTDGSESYAFSTLMGLYNTTNMRVAVSPETLAQGEELTAKVNARMSAEDLGLTYYLEKVENGIPTTVQTVKSTQRNYTFQPAQPGTYQVRVDIYGAPFTEPLITVVSATVQVTSNRVLSGLEIQAAGSTGKYPTGKAIAVTAAATEALESGDTLEYRFYQDTPGDYTAVSGLSWQVTPQSAGTYTLEARLTTADGTVSQKSLTFAAETDDLKAQTVTLDEVTLVEGRENTISFVGATQGNAALVKTISYRLLKGSTADKVTTEAATLANDALSGSFTLTPELGYYAVEMTVTSVYGGSSTVTSAAVAVKEAPPTISLTEVTHAAKGLDVELTATTGGNAVVEGVEFKVYAGQNTTNPVVAQSAAGNTAKTFTFTPTQLGIHTCVVTVTGVNAEAPATMTYEFEVEPNVRPTKAWLEPVAAMPDGVYCAYGQINGGLGLQSVQAQLFDANGTYSSTYQKAVEENTYYFTFENVPAGTYQVKFIVTDTKGQTHDVTGDNTILLGDHLRIRNILVDGIDANTETVSQKFPTGKAITITVNTQGELGQVEKLEYKVYPVGEEGTYATGTGLTWQFTPAAAGEYMVDVRLHTTEGYVTEGAKYFTVETDDLKAQSVTLDEVTLVEGRENTISFAGATQGNAALVKTISYRLLRGSAADKVTTEVAKLDADALTGSFALTPELGYYAVEMTVTSVYGGSSTVTSAPVSVKKAPPTISLTEITHAAKDLAVELTATTGGNAVIEGVEFKVYAGLDTTNPIVAQSAAGNTAKTFTFTPTQLGEHTCVVTATGVDAEAPATMTYTFTVEPNVRLTKVSLGNTAILPEGSVTGWAEINDGLGFDSIAAELVTSDGASVSHSTMTMEDKKATFTFDNVPAGTYQLKVTLTDTKGTAAHLTSQETVTAGDHLRLDSVTAKESYTSGKFPTGKAINFTAATTGTVGEQQKLEYRIYGSQADPETVSYTEAKTLSWEYTPDSADTYTLEVRLTTKEGFVSELAQSFEAEADDLAITALGYQDTYTLTEGQEATVAAAGQVNKEALVKSISYRLLRRTTANGAGTQVGETTDTGSFTFTPDGRYYTVEMTVTSVYGTIVTRTAPSLTVASDPGTAVGGAVDVNLDGGTVAGSDVLLNSTTTKVESTGTEPDTGDPNVKVDLEFNISAVSPQEAATGELADAFDQLQATAESNRNVVSDPQGGEPAGTPNVDMLEVEVVAITTTTQDDGTVTNQAAEAVTELDTAHKITFGYNTTGKTNFVVYSFHEGQVLTYSVSNGALIVGDGWLAIIMSQFSPIWVESYDSASIEYYDGTTQIQTGTYGVGIGTSSLYRPTKDGYDFVCWTDAAGNKVSSITSGADGTQTLYAKWTVTPTKTFSLHTTVDGNPATGDDLPMLLGILAMSAMSLLAVLIAGKKKRCF